jgi:hypothetical protein
MPPATFLVTLNGLAMISAPIAAPPMIRSSDDAEDQVH